jgi:IS605 OrfB family transposase
MQTGVLKIKLRDPNLGKAERLAALADEFTACVRFHWERIATLKTTNTVEIHRDCYREARGRFRLPASTIQQARDKAVSAYRSYLERKKRDRRCKPPGFLRTLPLRLAAENLRVFADRAVVRITTPDGFLWLPLIIPSCFADRLKLPHAVSEVVRKGEDWFLMLAVKSPDVPTPDGERPHFGIDLGLANLAVLAGPGVIKFFDGKPLRYVRGRYFRYRQALQKKRKTGMVMRSKGKEARWATGENHRVTREIVDLVARAGGTIHIERLTGIRERCKGTAKTNRMMAGWPFAQFGEFLRYKAAKAGVPVIEEDPRYTSQRCSKCGHTERGNRTGQDRFKCKVCGYESHADYNAARNLAARGACSPDVGDVTSPGRQTPRAGKT